MKILIVNKNENDGGAAKGAKRLYQSLLQTGVNVQYLVDEKTSDDHNILCINSKIHKAKKFFREQYDQLWVRSYKNRAHRVFSPNDTFFTSDLIKKISQINPDIVHLHWVNAAMISIHDLKKINKPIIWTMHDSWLFTGGCHLPYDCEKYENECFSCPALDSKKRNDLSNKIFKIKDKNFKQIDTTIVTPSHWLRDCCKASKLLKNNSIHVIPNAINPDIYRPIEKEIAKDLLGLPKNKKIILFGASDATSDLNKGFKQLSEAIFQLHMEDVLLVVVGGCEPMNAPKFPFQTIYLGRFGDEITMMLAYNCADVVVVPSLSENLSYTIMESLACGVPVVGFAIGGNGDLIKHKLSGYLADPFDTKDLKDGIEWILGSASYCELCVNARASVIKEFDGKMVAHRHLVLYNSVLQAR
jgi:glycosyltransferase involved in cell wall biosynthesis